MCKKNCHGNNTFIELNKFERLCFANRYKTFEIDPNIIEWIYVIAPYSRKSASFVMSYWSNVHAFPVIGRIFFQISNEGKKNNDGFYFN